MTEQLVATFNVDDHVREVVGSADRLCPAVAGSRPRSGLYTSSNFGGAIRKKEFQARLDAETAAEAIISLVRGLSGTCTGHADAWSAPFVNSLRG